MENTEIKRVTRNRKEAESTYNKISRWYDIIEGYWERKAIKLALQKLDAVDGEFVLEIGFGTGHGITAIADSVGNTGKVFGIDLSANMIIRTKLRLINSKLDNRAILHRGDAVLLPFKENSFDAIFMSFALELFDNPDIPKVLNGCFSTLKDKGRICVASLTNAGKKSFMRELYIYGHDKFPKLLDCRPIYVKESLIEVGFKILDDSQVSLLGIPVEIVLAQKLLV
jgi:demethylmenaquinone methyltransferase/2-methoxy-6-polyprenyl-1,4-benzoquinol methylase